MEGQGSLNLVHAFSCPTHAAGQEMHQCIPCFFFRDGMFPALEHAVRKIFLAGRKRKHFSTLAPGPCAQRGRNLAEKNDTQEFLSLEICQNNILRKKHDEPFRECSIFRQTRVDVV